MSPPQAATLAWLAHLAASPEVDAGGFLIHPKSHVVQAVSFAPGRSSWTVLDPSIKADFDAIAKLSDGDFFVVNRDDADATWLVAFSRDRGPVRYYSWDRKGQKGTFLFVHQPKLDGLQLAEMKPVKIKSRDGLILTSRGPGTAVDFGLALVRRLAGEAAASDVAAAIMA